ncbi:NAD(P)/FAD-dependent oxidoreductase [Synechococcus sp. RSCCF101]|uniref:NAD(P)/FAD-dependent oxidoreductase n=1 Tax=Synechococcus sp. RSCCF101 TaxID=2511069 RepID=UPI00351A30FD
MVGAGPAGGELSRRLALAGHHVCLVDRLTGLDQAAFSSAALPLASVADLGLPAGCVASRWNGWRLVGPDGRERLWQQRRPLGAVLDFAALRGWLAGEVRGWGSQVLLGWSAEAVIRNGREGALTELRDCRGRGRRRVRSRYVVDASGQGRALISAQAATSDQTDSGDPLIRGSGVEWLLRVDGAEWRRWSRQLSFFLGSRWIPRGYGWIFPMQEGMLKLGLCRLEVDGPARGPFRKSHAAPYAAHLRALLQHTGLAQAAVVDRHGGRIRSRVHRGDPHQIGQLLAVGDAVSTANLLGGEGIRHAMVSGRILAELLDRALRVGDGAGLRAYPQRLRQALGWRWGLSGRLAVRTWCGLDSDRGDRRLQRLMDELEDRASASDLAELLFDYRFERYGLRALPYWLGFRRGAGGPAAGR